MITSYIVVFVNKRFILILVPMPRGAIGDAQQAIEEQTDKIIYKRGRLTPKSLFYCLRLC